MYNSTHSILQHKMEVSGQCNILGTLTPESNLVPLNRLLGGLHSQSRRSGEKKTILPPL